jgi:hypothetical protein
MLLLEKFAHSKAKVRTKNDSERLSYLTISSSCEFGFTNASRVE